MSVRTGQMRAGDGNRTRNRLFTRQVRYRCATPASGADRRRPAPRGYLRASALAAVGGLTATGREHDLAQAALSAPDVRADLLAVDLDPRGGGPLHPPS